MTKTEGIIISETTTPGHLPPAAVTFNAPFEVQAPMMSNRPLRRSVRTPRQRFTDEEMDRLIESAKKFQPPQEWMDEDFTDLQ